MSSPRHSKKSLKVSLIPFLSTNRVLAEWNKFSRQNQNPRSTSNGNSAQILTSIYRSPMAINGRQYCKVAPDSSHTSLRFAKNICISSKLALNFSLPFFLLPFLMTVLFRQFFSSRNYFHSLIITSAQQWMPLILSRKLNLTIICISISLISSLQIILSYSEKIYSWLRTTVRMLGNFGRLRLNLGFSIEIVGCSGFSQLSLMSELSDKILKQSLLLDLSPITLSGLLLYLVDSRLV